MRFHLFTLCLAAALLAMCATAAPQILGIPGLSIPGLPGTAAKTTPVADPAAPAATPTANSPNTPVVIPIIPEITPPPVAISIPLPVVLTTPLPAAPATISSVVVPPPVTLSSSAIPNVSSAAPLPPLASTSSAAPPKVVLVSVTSTRALASASAIASATPVAEAATASTNASAQTAAERTKKVGVITAAVGGIVAGCIAAAALGIYIFRKVTLSPSGDFRKRMMRQEYSGGGAGGGRDDDAESGGAPSTHGSASRLTRAVDTYGSAAPPSQPAMAGATEYAVYPYDPSTLSAGGGVLHNEGAYNNAYADYGVEYGAYAAYPQQHPPPPASEYAESSHSGAAMHYAQHPHPGHPHAVHYDQHRAYGY
ncbi:hypothetical protein HDU90_009021 [Geranomyces variabilis]|nr:hypothetical protein HDU90_009021 [Geranomyces variabilis]